MKPWNKKEILCELHDLFKGLGYLPGPYHLEVYNNVVAVKHALRRVPIPLKDMLELKLAELEAKNKITKSAIQLTGLEVWFLLCAMIKYAFVLVLKTKLST